MNFIKSGVAYFPLFVACSLGAADGTWKWNEGGTSIDTAFDWSSADNWVDGVAPSGADDVATIPAATGARYVRINGPIALKRLVASDNISTSFGANRTILVSDQPVTLAGGGSPVGRGFELYADLVWPATSGKGWSQWLTLCGDVNDSAYGYYDTGFYHRLDRYANAAGATRVNPGITNCVSYSGGGYHYFGPQSSATNLVGRWSRKAGSPYLTRVGGAHALPVGTLVHGDGIAEGTYLKRVFSDSSIELSAAVSAEAVDGEIDVTFDAFTPIVRQYLNSWKRNNTAVAASIQLNKYRAEDTFELTVGKLEKSYSPSYYLFTTSTGFYPGTYVLRDATITDYEFQLGICHIQFEGTETAEAGFPHGVTRSYDGNTRAELTVTAGKTARIGCLQGLLGKVTKTGAGTLTVALTNNVSANTGTLVAQAGTLAVVCPVDSAAYVKTLAISNGATVTLTGDLRVDTLAAEPGAALKGPGRLLVAGAFRPAFDVVCSAGATIAVAGDAEPLRFEQPTGAVVRAPEPAVWFDAASADDFVLDADGESILRWKDHRGAGFEDVFATNVVYCPTRVAESGKKPYVKIPNVKTKVLSEMKLLVWSKKVTGIQAVFLATDPTDGGGPVLGRSSRITTTEGGSGGPFYRSSPLTMSSSIVHSYATANVRTAQFYLDGEEWNGTQQGYRGTGLQILECHPAGTGTLADAFGLCYVEGGAEAVYNGGVRLGECIVYTNKLTTAQRLAVAQYLSEKWCDRDIRYYECASESTAERLDAADGGLEVTEGTLAVTDVTGTGAFIKGGAGTLYLKAVKAGGLHVAGGTAVLRSSVLDRSVVPQTDCWLHLDASDRASFTLNAEGGTNFVTRWNDCRTNGLYLTKAVASTSGNRPADSWIRTAAQNGLDCVDTGPVVRKCGTWAQADPNRTLEFYDADGNRFRDSTGAYFGDTAPDVQSCFIVYSAEGGGNSLLASRGNNFYAYGFPALSDYTKAEAWAPTTIFNNDGNQWAITQLQTAIGYQAVDVRLDGVQINPFTTAFTDEFRLFAYHSGNFARKTQALACSGFDNWTGGLLYGEVVLYSKCLSAEVRNHVEAYLAKKWFDRDTPGYRPAEVGALTVDAGAVLQVRGAAAVQATSLSGAGRVEGDVVLAADGGFAVSATAGVPDKTIVAGTLTLPASGVVTLLFDPAAVKPGTYAIVAADALVGSVADWTVALPAGARAGARDMLLAVRDNQVWMTIARKGTLLLVR